MGYSGLIDYLSDSEIVKEGARTKRGKETKNKTKKQEIDLDLAGL